MLLKTRGLGSSGRMNVSLWLDMGTVLWVGDHPFYVDSVFLFGIRDLRNPSLQLVSDIFNKKFSEKASAIIYAHPNLEFSSAGSEPLFYTQRAGTPSTPTEFILR